MTMRDIWCQAGWRQGRVMLAALVWAVCCNAGTVESVPAAAVSVPSTQTVPAAPSNAVSRLVTNAVPSSTNSLPLSATNGIPLSSPSTLPTQRDAVYAWPAMPPAWNATAGVAVRLPAQRRILSPSAPHGMRLIPGAAFETVADRLTGSVQCAAYYMDTVEVTEELWNGVAWRGRDCGYADLPAGNTDPERSRHPVTGVSWFDCLKWCNARSEADGLVPVYYTEVSRGSVYRTGIVQEVSLTVDGTANGYRLPTSLEWEAACRGGRKGALYPWGDDFLSRDKANYWDSGNPAKNGTAPVATYDGRQVVAKGGGPGRNMINGYGLYDMAGNVAEWCQDCAALPPRPAGSRTGVTAPRQRVVRGGSWRSRDESLLLCGFEGHAPPMTRADNLGFRTVRAR